MVIDKNSYFNCLIEEWWLKDNVDRLNDRNLKIYIINDLKSIGVDITKVDFFVKVYGIQKINVKVYYKNEYTREVLGEYTKKQLERKLKIDSLEL